MNTFGKRAKNIMAIAATVVIGAQFTGLSALAFTDSNNHWAAQDINRLSQQNIIGGYADGTFRPHNTITRAEFATTLVKALNLQLNTSAYAGSGFNDVPSNHWAAPYIETVKAQGIISGYPGNVFMPNKNITRAEVVTILSGVDRNAMPANFSVDAELNKYSDNYQVPSWAAEAVAEASYTNILENDPSRSSMIEPNRSATRGEVAAMLVNMNQNMSGVASANTNTYQQPTQNNYYDNNNNNTNAIVGRVLVVPDNTEVVATIDKPLHTDVARIGDQVVVTVKNPVLSNASQVAIPSGSKLIGKVSMLEDAGRAGKSAKLAIDFNELIMPNGERAQIQAQIATEDGDGILKGESTKARVLKAAGRTAVGAGLGAALGTAMGPLSGGSVGRGAIYGTAIGAGAGAVSAGIDKGEEVVLPTGAELDIRFTQALTLSGPQIPTYSYQPQ